MSVEKYFNFPIQLLEGFLVNHKPVLNNICDYAIYSHYLNLEYGNEEEKIKQSASFFGVSLGSIEYTLDKGQLLVDSIPRNSPKVGINLSIYWDYYKNDKSEFEKVTLLGFLAIKSILQNKSYCKLTNKYWLSRMDGKTKSVRELSELTPSISLYANEYQTKKIKTELRDNWNLITYSRYTRGFYVSFKMVLDDLVYQAEKRRKSTKDKQAKLLENLAYKKAMDKLGV